jgi:hypothetical protein
MEGRGSPIPVVVSTTVGKAERAVKPESIALGVFGGIAALAALLIVGQVIDRQLRLGADDLGALRALGADLPMVTLDPLIGILGAVVLGSLLAAVVAVGLSPLAPIGPVRPFYPTPGVAIDWTVLGLGAAVLAACLGALSVALAVRSAPHRVAAQRQRAAGRRSVVARAQPAPGFQRRPWRGSGSSWNPGPPAVRYRCGRRSWVPRWP